MKLYVAGKITDNPNYKELFAKAEKELLAQGHYVMNPSVLPAGFEHHEYMKICFSMIDVCDGIFLLDNWEESKGARMEYLYSRACQKILLFQSPCEMEVS